MYLFVKKCIVYYIFCHSLQLHIREFCIFQFLPCLNCQQQFSIFRHLLFMRLLCMWHMVRQIRSLKTVAIACEWDCTKTGSDKNICSTVLFFAFAVLRDLGNKSQFFLSSHITMLFKSAHRHNSAWNWVTYLFMLSIAYVAFFEVDRCKKDLQAVLHEPSSYQEVANIIPVCTCFHLPLPIDTCIVCVCEQVRSSTCLKDFLPL